MGAPGETLTTLVSDSRGAVKGARSMSSLGREAFWIRRSLLYQARRRRSASPTMTTTGGTPLEPWEWPEPHWRAVVDQVRAGRSLRPRAWKDGARCAFA